MSTILDCTEAPPAGHKAVLLFWAPWHEASVEGGPMDQVLRALAASATTPDENIIFGRVQAEEQPELTKLYQVKAVPTFVLLSAGGTVVEQVQANEDVSRVTQAVQRLLQLPRTVDPAAAAAATTTVAPTKSAEEQLNERLGALVRSSEVMLFIKGTPTAPRCGFSRQAVELLQAEDIPFGSFNILSDETVRQGLKTYSNWPTYPQLYVKGTLVGGLDILKEMKEDGGSLREQLGITATAKPPQSLDERLKQLLQRSPVMLFMKGLPSAPKCGFSRQIVEMLDAEQIPYDAFDILQDEEVRQGLKTFSNWPTYPQLYVNGTLIGGLDIVKEMKEENDGKLKEALGL